MIILRATLILEATICPDRDVPITTLKGEMVNKIADKAKEISEKDIEFEWRVLEDI